MNQASTQLDRSGGVAANLGDIGGQLAMDHTDARRVSQIDCRLTIAYTLEKESHGGTRRSNCRRNGR